MRGCVCWNGGNCRQRAVETEGNQGGWRVVDLANGVFKGSFSMSHCSKAVCPSLVRLCDQGLLLHVCHPAETHPEAFKPVLEHKEVRVVRAALGRCHEHELLESVSPSIP